MFFVCHACYQLIYVTYNYQIIIHILVVFNNSNLIVDIANRRSTKAQDITPLEHFFCRQHVLVFVLYCWIPIQPQDIWSLCIVAPLRAYSLYLYLWSCSHHLWTSIGRVYYHHRLCIQPNERQSRKESGHTFQYQCYTLKLRQMDEETLAKYYKNLISIYNKNYSKAYLNFIDELYYMFGWVSFACPFKLSDLKLYFLLGPQRVSLRNTKLCILVSHYSKTLEIQTRTTNDTRLISLVTKLLKGDQHKKYLKQKCKKTTKVRANPYLDCVHEAHERVICLL